MRANLEEDKLQGTLHFATQHPGLCGRTYQEAILVTLPLIILQVSQQRRINLGRPSDQDAPW